MSVFAFRTREQVSLLYALTGLGLLLASSSAAVYSSRELALDEGLFYALSLTNQFGSLLFAGPFISILWYYPKRLHPFPLGPVLIAVYLLSWVLNALQLFDSLDVAMRLPLFLGLAINLSLALVQWRLSRHQPLQRAILKWFLLAWLTGTTLYLGLYTLPLVLELDTVINQSLGWGVLVTVYLGIAMGITRFRLFNLDRWVVTGWFWFLGGVAVIAFDALLVYSLDLSDQLALAIALGIAGWLYFPIRQILWSRFSWSRKLTDYRELLPHLLTTLLNTQAKGLAAEWRQILERIYSPLHIEPLGQTLDAVHIDQEGVSLLIPGIQDIPGLRLTYAERGNRLFNTDDRRFADAIHQLFCRIQAFRDAFADGVQQERRRLARDLHDDVGARLLTLVYSAGDETQADLARETLSELRSVIRDLESRHNTLLKTLAELRAETARRSESHGVELEWRQDDALEDLPLEARQHANLKRILREAVSNALRHSQASRLQVDVGMDGVRLILQISNDDADKDGDEDPSPGRGIHNIRSRAEELGGGAAWWMGEESLLGGCTVRVELPVQEQ
jgi:signal transduction histidine kinase